MRDLVFFYGTLMAGFDRRQRAGIEDKLRYVGRGSIQASLFDLGLYPAAVPAPEGIVWGEVYEVVDAAAVLSALDGIEGYQPADHDRSLYVRAQADVTRADGGSERAWVYFYNAPLGGAQRILSGDYLEHVRCDDDRGAMTEKRDAPRVQIPGQVLGEVTVYEPMTIHDMSDSGAQIETRFPLHLDSLHDFRLSLDDRSVIVKGRIVHSQIGELTEGGVMYRTGLEFVELSEHAKAAIRGFVEAKQLEALEPPPVVEAVIVPNH